MANYTVLAECGCAFVGLLRREMGSAIAQENAIALCSPAERGDAALGVYLYDVEREALCAVSPSPLDASRRRAAPLPLRLCYMLTAYADGDARYRQEEEQRLLGRAMQVLHDHPALDVSPEVAGNGRIAIEWRPLSFEEKSRIWSALGQPYRPSLFYALVPVLLESGRVQTVSRVISVAFEKDGAQ